MNHASNKVLLAVFPLLAFISLLFIFVGKEFDLVSFTRKASNVFSNMHPFFSEENYTELTKQISIIKDCYDNFGKDGLWDALNDFSNLITAPLRFAIGFVYDTLKMFINGFVDIFNVIKLFTGE